ncbi:S8 family serine peptidase [Micromonospora lupini]|uniref:S8 family serine peptidase n=1 Tax=Micromonospora lupini TaxID=285679 RepID=UPI002252346F|nr:S8 family serine peptidase [Micromonospora lupini]MCX5068900.1 S8 family serine peptidase [Micromonospora lupini]
MAAAALALCAALAPAVTVAPAPAQAADTVRGLQWYLDYLKVPAAHKITKGAGVVVAVVDTGVEASHPDLRGQVLAGHGTTAAAARDGRRDDDPVKGHGTRMSGIVAARGGGAMHELGIAPAAKILPVSMSDRFNDDDVAMGVRWAADAGADVINLSLRSSTNTAAAPGVVDAINYALGKNAVVVAAAGNIEDGDRQVSYPANIPGVVAVTGLDKRGGFFAGSVQGPEAVIAGPMDSIIGPVPKAVSPNGYSLGSGTSSAAAIISGVVALIRSEYPKLDAANVINRLIKTARDAGPPGRDPQFGFGTVDLLAALTRSVPPVTANPLLESAAAGPTRPGGVARPGDDDGPAVEFGVTNKAGAIVQVALCLGVPIIALIVLLVVLRRRKRRSPPAGSPYPGAPGTPPPGWPATPPTPAGYGPPPGQPGPGYPPPSYPAQGHPPAPTAPAPPPGASGWPGSASPPPGPQQQQQK